MPINQNSVKATVFKFLKTNGYKPTMLDSSGKEMAITDDADVFQFNFIKDGENYGTITIGIDGTGELTLYFGDDVADSPAGSTDDGMLSFHDLTSRLRKLTFGKVSKFDLSDIENLKYDMAKRENTKKLDEGYYPMGKSGSYSDAVPTVKMVIKHTRKIEEGEQRYRNIAQIFIENSLGERVLAPTTKPGLARPFARHIAEGGLPNDERWNHIREMCEDYTKMAGFVRATKNGQFNESTQQLVTEGTEHYLQLRESLRKMAGKRGYNEHFDNWSPTLIEDAAGADLSEMFMNATLDPRIESAMPILSKISRGRNSMNEVAEISELSEWADQLVSERLAPKSMSQLDDLAGMLSDEIVVGPNAMNAKAMLASVNLEDDELNGLLEELSEQDPDADAVETIINWMEQSDDHRMHSVIDKIERPTTPEVAESLRPGERHHYEDDPETGERVYKGIRGDQYQSPKKPHQFPDDSQARAQRQHDRQEPKEGVAEGSETHKYQVVVKGHKRSYSVWVDAKNEDVAIIRAQQYVAQEHNDTAKRAAVVDMKQGVAEGEVVKGPWSGMNKPEPGERYVIIRTKPDGEKDFAAGTFDSWQRAKEELQKFLDHSLHTKFGHKFEIIKKQQGVAEGFSDIVKGVKRKVAGKADPKEVEKDYAVKARREIGDANRYNNPAAYADSDKAVKRYNKVAKVVNKEGVAEASMAPNARIDPQSTTQYGMKIVNALNQQFGDYFNYKMNQDGSFTVVQKKGSGPENQYDPRYENDPTVLTPQSISRVIDPYYNMFRQKGWRFDQPMGGEFTIAIPEEQAVSEDLEANQQRVGQLGPKAKHAKPGDLVGVDESTDSLAAIRRLSGLIK